MNTYEKMKKEREDVKIIAKIVERADNLNLLQDDRIALMMDLDVANKQFNLRLTELLESDNFNFSHDIIGIQNNINRRTKKINHLQFVPRFAKNKR